MLMQGMQDHAMKEAVLYVLGAITSLFILGYTVHMMVGGLVSQQTENAAIVGIIVAGMIGIGFMTWDVIRRRR
ncbi:MAG: hypothetical protein BMS9Abin18_0132 [Zetaproteobacteria bacterium]|nr:MAG: hypothetical protein BMS9Abin18_0132 [Zetaproteobacteria bacterium]